MKFGLAIEVGEDERGLPVSGRVLDPLSLLPVGTGMTRSTGHDMGRLSVAGRNGHGQHDNRNTRVASVKSAFQVFFLSRYHLETWSAGACPGDDGPRV